MSAMFIDRRPESPIQAPQERHVRERSQDGDHKSNAHRYSPCRSYGAWAKDVLGPFL